MNSTVKLSFKVVFVEKSTCTFHEQCTGSTKKTRFMNNAQDLLKKRTHWETHKTRFPYSRIIKEFKKIN